MRISDFTSDNFKNSSTIVFIVVLLLAFWFYIKSESAVNTVIAIEITDKEEIIFDGNYISKQDFSSAANSIISRLEAQGISSDKIVIALHADRNLRMGVIADVQQELRNCELNKIVYAR
jgi:biopolymer transport protein ExbD